MSKIEDVPKRKNRILRKRKVDVCEMKFACGRKKSEGGMNIVFKLLKGHLIRGIRCIE